MLKTVAQSAVTGALVYQGTWNASTNTPTLTSSVGTKGYYYVVSFAGSTNLDGITDWQVGDWAVFNGSVWQKVDNTDAVTSVNGQTGTVVLTAANVGATANTTYVLAGGLLSGGGQLNGNVTISLTSISNANVTGLGTMSTQNANSVAITGGNVSANISLTNATNTSATFATSSLPLVPAGYLKFQLANSTVVLVPYYAQ
jgi:hypothetical protein